MILTTQIVQIGKDVRVLVSTALWITPETKTNGRLVVPKRLEIFTIGSCLQKDFFVCKKPVVSKFNLVFLIRIKEVEFSINFKYCIFL